MNFEDPTIVFTAATNVEAQLVAELLRANGIEAMAVEDQSGVSLWAFGTISQFHKPNVYVDKRNGAAAAELVREFEATKRERQTPADEDPDKIAVTCEDCGKTSLFPGKLNGTTQECPRCRAFLYVGDFPWDEADPGEEPR